MIRRTFPRNPRVRGNSYTIVTNETHFIIRYKSSDRLLDLGIARRPPDHRKEIQTAVVWSCLTFIRSGQNRLARHSERGKKTRQTEEEVGRQHRGMDRPGVRQVPEGSGEQGKMEETGCEIGIDDGDGGGLKAPTN